tara:strand:- start:1430 stop:2425 length:996 start_codon:yes stop_codon:yes gene_type:complete
LLEKKKILFAVLNWGLGHATRSWELIRELTEKGYEVVLASDGEANFFLQKEFPELENHSIPSYNIKYGKNNTILSMLLNGVKIQSAVRNEKKWLKQFLKENKINQIISDNRYGIFDASIPSVIITHQINIKAPFASRFVNFQNRLWLNKFHEIWIPDVNGELSGDLSKPIPNSLLSKVKEIGWLSRFKQNKKAVQKQIILAIVSGPEPQKTILSARLKSLLAQLEEESILYMGCPGINQNQEIGNLTVKGHASTNEFAQDLANAKIVIGRSGYSSLMDYKILNKKMILIPTPGQDEQVYLGKYLSVNSEVTLISQKDLNFTNLKSAIIDAC